MAIWSVSANDAFKGELVRAKILELSIDMVALAHRSQKNLKKKVGFSKILELSIDMVAPALVCVCV
jgi:hypothetical protein